tara:strand:- start:14 stop:325 length:312 start_codon:yes stop_codon:yes gene_type:complete
MTTRFVELDKFTNEIYLDDALLGIVKMDFSSRRWRMEPVFFVSSFYQDYVDEKYFSFYDSGKAMVELYNKIEDRKKKSKFKPFDPLGDANEFDMDDLVKSWSP